MSRSLNEIFGRDWDRAVIQGPLGQRFAIWRRTHEALLAFVGPSSVIRFLRHPGSSAAKDRVLFALLSEARTDPLAGRVVLEAIRPGLLGLSGRVLVDSRERDELPSLLLTGAWERICGYPLEQRPRRIAANLLLDTLRHALKELRSMRHGMASLDAGYVHPETPDTRPSDEGGIDALMEAAVRASAITPAEAEIILATRFDGVTVASLAAGEGVPYNTMKLRRQRAERRLLFFLGYSSVPRGQQNRPSSFARVAGA